jgi:hypothetical protein
MQGGAFEPVEHVDRPARRPADQEAAGDFRGVQPRLLERGRGEARQERPRAVLRPMGAQRLDHGIAVSCCRPGTRLDLEVDVEIELEAELDRLRQRRDRLAGEAPGEPAAGIEALELVQVVLRHLAAAVGGPPSRSSCIRMHAPSRLSLTSTSIQVAPSALARRMAASVFSGAAAEAPRCAITLGRRASIVSIPIVRQSVMRHHLAGHGRGR